MNQRSNLIALWGAFGSGKTSNLIKLALTLAEHKKTVIVIFPEDTCPAIPCICAESEYSHTGTLGSVFIAPQISSSLISYQLTTTNKIPTLAFLGYGKGENRYTYPAPTSKQCEKLLTECSKMADYVLVDVSSNFVRDVLSSTALLNSDLVVRLETLDIKNVGYLSSNLSLLLEHPKFNTEKQIRVLNDTFDTSWDITKQKKSYDFTLPFCSELIAQSRMGNLLDTLKDKESLAYKKQIIKLSNLITRKVDKNENN